MKKISLYGLVIIMIVAGSVGTTLFFNKKIQTVDVNEYAAFQLLEQKIIPLMPKELDIWIQWQNMGKSGVVSIPLFVGDTLLARWVIGFDLVADGTLHIKPNPVEEEIGIPDNHPAFFSLARIIVIAALEGTESLEAKPFVESTKSLSDENSRNYVRQLFESYSFGRTREDFALIPGYERKDGFTESGLALFSAVAKKKSNTK